MNSSVSIHRQKIKGLRRQSLRVIDMSDSQSIVLASAAALTSPIARRRRAQALSQSIESVRQDGHAVQQVSSHQIEETADRYSRLTSTALTGIVGGAIG